MNTCLEWILEGRETLESAVSHFPNEAAEMRPLLESALWLQAQAQKFDLQEGRRQVLKRRLLSRIKQENALRPARRTTTWLESLTRQPAFVLRAALTLILVLALTLGSIGVAQASQGSIPGDDLYPVKITLEDTQLAFSLSPVQDARLHIKFINRRVNEIQFLILENRFEFLRQAIGHYQQEVQEALQSLNEASKRLPSQSILLANELHDTLRNQLPVFQVMAETIPATFRGDLIRMQEVTDTGISATTEVITSTERMIKPGVTLVMTESQQAGFRTTPIPSSGAMIVSTSTPSLIPTIPAPTQPVVKLSLPTPLTMTPTSQVVNADDEEDGERIIPTRKPTKTPRPSKLLRLSKTPRGRN